MRLIREMRCLLSVKTPGNHESMKQGSRTRAIPLTWATYMCFGVLAVFALLTQAGMASAATFKVTNTHSSGSGSLRHAIKQANSGGDHSDTIAVKATGTIRLGARLPNLRTHLAIKGPGASKLTVRPGRGTSSTFSIFTVSPHVTVKLSGISVTNGLGSGIGTKGRLTLSHSVVSDNKGAGVEIDDFGTLTASQVRVRDNAGGGLAGRQTVHNRPAQHPERQRRARDQQRPRRHHRLTQQAERQPRRWHLQRWRRHCRLAQHPEGQLRCRGRPLRLRRCHLQP